MSRPTDVTVSAEESLQRDTYDALVIGSGFGGAVAACRLAQAGVDVAIVERGRRWPPGSFPRDLSRLDDGWLWLCNQGLYDARPLNDILAVQAAGYGGGSLVYANVAMRPPDEAFDDAWPASYSRAELDPYFDLVSYMLDVRPVGPDPATGRLPPKTRFMEQAAERLGQPDGFCHPNLAVTFEETGPDHRNRFGVPQRACVFCGECDIGCNRGAKNSLDLNYLALAERHGAAVGTLTQAVHIGRDGDGYRVRLRELGHPGGGRDGVERDVTARRVFVCAGAIGTTELLLRSRDQYGTLPELPPSLGHGYSGNGDFLSFGRGVRTPFAPGSGPTITTASLLHTENAGRQQWFVLEDGGYSKHLAALVAGLDVTQLPAQAARAITAGLQRIVASSRQFGRALEESGEHTAALLVMGRDRADGVISLRGARRRLHLSWDVPGNDPLYTAQSAISGEVVRAFGGRPFGSPTWRAFRQPVTVHNLGGARMGDSPETGVVDEFGRVFGHPGLYVLDGAAIPGPTGANPSLTIAAVAERCVETAVREITGDVTWVAPERAVAPVREVPEDAVVRAVVARPVRTVAVPGVAFRETMSGHVAGRRVTMRLRGTHPRPASVPERPRPPGHAHRHRRRRRGDRRPGAGRGRRPAPAGRARRRPPADHGLSRPVHRGRRHRTAAARHQGDPARPAQRSLARDHAAGVSDRRPGRPVRGAGADRPADHLGDRRGQAGREHPADLHHRAGAGCAHAGPARHVLRRRRRGGVPGCVSPSPPGVVEAGLDGAQVVARAPVAVVQGPAPLHAADPRQRQLRRGRPTQCARHRFGHTALPGRRHENPPTIAPRYENPGPTSSNSAPADRNDWSRPPVHADPALP